MVSSLEPCCWLLVVKELEYQLCVGGRFHDQGSGSVLPRKSQQCVAHYQL